MPSPNRKRRRVHVNPDHTRRTHVPAPSDAEIEYRLDTLVKPAVYAELDYYRQLGYRNRLLGLPVMVALVLALIWRRVPGVCTLQRMLARERILWTEPITVSQPALSERFLTFPAVLFERVLYRVLARLPERQAARTRPLPSLLATVRSRFQACYALDGTTLEALFRKLQTLREQPQAPLAGHLGVAVDLISHLPAKLWWADEAATNDKALAPDIVEWLSPESLVVFDLGYFAFWLFDHLTAASVCFVTRMREKVSYRVQHLLVNREHVRDQIVQLGIYKGNGQCQHLMRLVEVYVNGRWQRYLTNVLDPQRLNVVEVVALYDARWSIETTFLLIKRLLDLAYVWVGSLNGVRVQVFATFLFYAILIDLCDDVAEQVGVALEQISVEMVYRGLYHYVTAVHQEVFSGDAPSYLAREANGLGIIKRQRSRDGPSVTEQIRRALVAPPLPDGNLTDCEGA
jgi:Transposase DDE domain